MSSIVNKTSFVLFIQELKVFLDNQIGKPIKRQFQIAFFHLLEHRTTRKYNIQLSCTIPRFESSKYWINPNKNNANYKNIIF